MARARTKAFVPRAPCSRLAAPPSRATMPSQSWVKSDSRVIPCWNHTRFLDARAMLAPMGFRPGFAMHIANRAVVIACVIFAGALIGNGLQTVVPTHHLSDAKGAIGMIQGLVTLLLALVLGLLIWTSYGIYAQQRSEAYTLGSQILQLVLALHRYGPEADQGRELLRQELQA